MKHFFSFLIVMLTTITIARTQGVGIGTSTPHPSARLHISGTGKGLLIPRTNTSGMFDITAPAKGLMIYDTSKHELMVNMGTSTAPNWKPVSQNSGWAMKGNAGTDQNTHFIGTTDNSSLHFRIRNVHSGKIDSVHQGTAFGYKAGHRAISAHNTAIGYKALAGTDGYVGQANTAIGSEALTSITTGAWNIGVGAFALKSLSSGIANVAVGMRALEMNTYGSSNIGIGESALFANQTGDINTAVGTHAMLNNTAGLGNSAFGYRSLSANISADYNTAMGCYSLSENTTGDYNCALGYSSLTLNTTGVFNVGIGVYALNLNTTGNENIAMGYRSMESNTTGIRNISIGVTALGENTTGSYNSAIGYRALEANTTGGQNTAMGLHALIGTTASSFNTAMGMDAGRYHNLGWNNTFIGSNANASANGIFNSIALGEGATATASNQVRVGNVSITSIGGFANWSNLSDGRFKTDVREDVHGLDFIMRLRPVTYHLDAERLQDALTQGSDSTRQDFTDAAIAEKAAVVQTGFIAQEVEEAARAIGYAFSGVDAPKTAEDFYALRYAEFVVPLVKAVQELQQKVTELENRLR